MVKIVYTKHATGKFLLLAKRGVKISKTLVDKTVRHPENIDIESDKPKNIISKSVDRKHVLRVVYLRENDIIKIITFYPAEKGRYY